MAVLEKFDLFRDLVIFNNAKFYRSTYRMKQSFSADSHCFPDFRSETHVFFSVYFRLR
jgi:hypothetical protein